MQKGLSEFFEKLKELGFLTKLDTNGSSPKMLEMLIQKELLDYVAMDIKAPIEKYKEIARVNIDTNNILKSIEILKDSKIGYEFRTTTVKSQLGFEDFEKIGKMLCGAENYYLQKFKPDITLNPDFAKEKTYTDEEFFKIKTMLLKYIKNVHIR